MIEGHEKCALRKEPVIAPFVERFKFEVFQMNSIRTYRNFLKKFIFAHLLLPEDYDQGALGKESVIATFIEQFKIATLRKSY